MRIRVCAYASLGCEVVQGHIALWLVKIKGERTLWNRGCSIFIPRLETKFWGCIAVATPPVSCSIYTTFLEGSCGPRPWVFVLISMRNNWQKCCFYQPLESGADAISIIFRTFGLGLFEKLSRLTL